MSKFITVYQLDVQAVIESLPAGSLVSSIKLTDSKRALEIEWSNNDLQTPYTIPWPFPIDNFTGDLPKGVTRKIVAPIVEKIDETKKDSLDKKSLKGRNKKV